MQSHKATRIWISLLIGLMTVPALAETAQPEPTASYARALAAVQALADDGNWVAAERAATDLTNDIARGGDPEDAFALAHGISLRAFTLAGLERPEAAWYRTLARDIGPDSPTLDAEDRPRMGTPIRTDQPPRPVTTPYPVLDPALRATLLPDRIAVRIRIDVSGQPVRAEMLAGHSPFAAYHALEALRQWRFEPALQDGAPVASSLDVIIPFAADADADTLSSWSNDLDEIEAHLRDGAWDTAHQAGIALVEAVVQQTGRGGSDWLARAIGFQALAEAGKGLDSKAIWSWQVAGALSPQIQTWNLAPYGPAGATLASVTANTEPFAAPSASVPPIATPTVSPSPGHPAEAPLDLDVAVVEISLDDEGRPRDPRVVQGRTPAALAATLLTLGSWRFAIPPETSSRNQDNGHQHAGGRFTVAIPMIATRPAPLAEIAPHEIAMRMVSFATEEANRGALDKAIASWNLAQTLDPRWSGVPVDVAPEIAAHFDANRFVPLDHWPLRIQPKPMPRPQAAPAAPTPAQSKPASQSTPSTQAPSGPLHVNGNVKVPRKIHTPGPRYTNKARKSGVQGVVIVQVIIDKTGRVGEIKVLKGLPDGLNKAATDAISQWRFEPATLDGKPVAVYYNLTVNFRLE